MNHHLKCFNKIKGSSKFVVFDSYSQRVLC